MKRLSTSAAAILTAACSLWASSPKFSAGASLELGKTALELRATRANPAERMLSAIIILNPGHSFDELAAEGFQVKTKVSETIATVIFSADDAERLAALDAVKSVNMGQDAVPTLNKAREATQVNPVQLGTENLPQPFTGTGVLCGIFDTGIDPNHITFRDAAGNSRVEVFNNYNSLRQYIGAEVANATTDSQQETHGTHTAGIMGGNGAPNNTKSRYAEINANGAPTVLIPTAKSPNPFWGMARNSRLYLNGGQLTQDNNVDAITNTLKFANEHSMPLVYNLSIGNNLGPHDGTSAMSQVYAEKGKDMIICLAAGNEGSRPVSITKKLAANEAMTTATIQIKQYGYQFWNTDNTPLKAELIIYKGSTGQVLYSLPAQTNQTLYLTPSAMTNAGYIHNTNFDDNFTADSYVIIEANVDPNNNRYYAQFYYNAAYSNSNKDADVILAMRITPSKATTVYGFTNGGFSNFGVSSWTAGSPDNSISDLATGDNIICVGSYCSRFSWATLSKGIYNYQNSSKEVGEVSPFSSYGHSFQGRQLPDLLGPGESLISSLNSYYTTAAGFTTSSANASAYFTDPANNRVYYFGNEMGTSMATPSVAGIIALWLEAAPTLTVAQVKDIMKQTCINDAFTAAAPLKSGFGKIDALAGLRKAMIIGGVDNVTADSDQRSLIIDMRGNEIDIFLAGAKKINATIYDTAGTLVAAASADNCSTLLPKPQKGLYIIHISDGTRSYSRKIAL